MLLWIIKVNWKCCTGQKSQTKSFCRVPTKLNNVHNLRKWGSGQCSVSHRVNRNHSWKDGGEVELKINALTVHRAGQDCVPVNVAHKCLLCPFIPKYPVRWWDLNINKPGEGSPQNTQIILYTLGVEFTDWLCSIAHYHFIFQVSNKNLFI